MSDDGYFVFNNDKMIHDDDWYLGEAAQQEADDVHRGPGQC